MAAPESSTRIPALFAPDIEKLRPGDPPPEWRAAHSGENEWKAGDYEVPDADASGRPNGLRIRVFQSGGKTWRWYATSAGRVITLGRFSLKPRPGFVTLAEARAVLEKLKAGHKDGKLDEAIAKFCPRRPSPPKPSAPAAGAVTVRAFAEGPFMDAIKRRRFRPDVVEQVISKIIVPMLGDRPIASIETEDAERVIVAVVEGRHPGAKAPAPTHAAKVRQIGMQMFRQAMRKARTTGVTHNPFDLDPGDLGIVARVCDRVLSDEEIPAFWRALDTLPTPVVRSALRLLLLLGVRTGELLQARWEEIDFEDALWTIPVEHRKLTRKQRDEGAKPLRVPLGPTSLAILTEMKALADSIGSPFVCASFARKLKGEKKGQQGEPIEDKVLGHGMRRLFEGEEPALRFKGERPTAHDLRRTFRDGLDRLDVEPYVSELCLGHALGRVFRTYAKSDHLDKRRDAIARWDSHVADLVADKSASVVALKARKAARS